MDLLSISGLIVGICALIQAAYYNHAANKLNKHTEQMQKSIETTINYTNLINMYTFLKVREISNTANQSSDKNMVISMVKDTIIFNKSAEYSNKNAKKCKEIIFQSGLIKPYLYEEKISHFLCSNEQMLNITLRFELSHSNLEYFLSMATHLLNYNITVLHSIYFS